MPTGWIFDLSDAALAKWAKHSTYLDNQMKSCLAASHPLINCCQLGVSYKVKREERILITIHTIMAVLNNQMVQAHFNQLCRPTASEVNVFVSV